MKKLISFIFLIFIVSGSLSAQNMLALKNTARVKIHYYPEGSVISLGMDTLRITGRITSISDSMLVINKSIFVPVQKIDYLIRQRFWLKFNSASVKGFSILYFAGTGIGRAANKWYPVYRVSDFLITGAIFGSAILLKWLWNKKYHIGKKWKLEVINPDLQVLE